MPWKEEPSRLQSIGSQRVRHDWSDLAGTRAFATSGTSGGCPEGPHHLPVPERAGPVWKWRRGRGHDEMHPSPPRISGLPCPLPFTNSTIFLISIAKTKVIFNFFQRAIPHIKDSIFALLSDLLFSSSVSSSSIFIFLGFVLLVFQLFTESLVHLFSSSLA